MAAGGPGTALAARSARRSAILSLVDETPVGSQEELAALLRARGFAVTQATVSRDIAELGLVKAARGDRHLYVTPRSLAAERAGPAAALPHPGSERLHRIIADYPVRIARSGLSLVLIGAAGTAAVIAQAIDESDLDDQVGTLAGDNTLLVLFADESALERWQARFGAIVAPGAGGGEGSGGAGGGPGDDLTGAYP